MISRETLAMALIALIMFSVLLFENNMLSRKIAVIYKVLNNIEFYIKDGVCEQ